MHSWAASQALAKRPTWFTHELWPQGRSRYTKSGYVFGLRQIWFSALQECKFL